MFKGEPPRPMLDSCTTHPLLIKPLLAMFILMTWTAAATLQNIQSAP